MKLAWMMAPATIVTVVMLFVSPRLVGDEPGQPPEPTTTNNGFEPPAGLTPLTKDDDVWIDTKRRLVVVDGEVCLREGQLEMFACPRGTKEHESVVTVNSKAQYVHAGLLAVGAKSGHPARFDPKYEPATGTIVDIFVLWKDAEERKQKVPAQEWIRDIKTGKAMTYDWVFAGSGFWRDPDTGDSFYHGDGGDFICVSNFPSATLDLPVASSQANSALLFEAFTEHVPPVGTKIRLVMIPRLKDEKQPAKPSQDASLPADAPQDSPGDHLEQ